MPKIDHGALLNQRRKKPVLSQNVSFLVRGAVANKGGTVVAVATPKVGYGEESEFSLDASCSLLLGVPILPEQELNTRVLVPLVLASDCMSLLRRGRRSSSAWAMLGEWPTWDCNRYGYCSPYCYCDSTMMKVVLTSKCLAGFEPMSMAEWDSGRFSRGCWRKEVVQCGDCFLVVPGMKSPDKLALIANTMFDARAAECSSNWSCVAYAYANLSSSRSKEDMTRCLVWAGELVDMQKASEGLGSDTLYLRLAGLDAGKH
ncbi:hypothetical protein E2562_002123 [Oryza meyeriana var. granulata]|uniref:Apple domain-containing protein n=1 Tax=Oryza meyeriana var. granulata TaxID=110450 RepID=A0A6G1EEN0_9ORYZ|nr:hypothetical protein E2562_002123 [Oryza meyeriana var. granulata]